MNCGSYFDLRPHHLQVHFVTLTFFPLSSSKARSNLAKSANLLAPSASAIRILLPLELSTPFEKYIKCEFQVSRCMAWNEITVILTEIFHRILKTLAGDKSSCYSVYIVSGKWWFSKINNLAGGAYNCALCE